MDSESQQPEQGAHAPASQIASSMAASTASARGTPTSSAAGNRAQRRRDPVRGAAQGRRDRAGAGQQRPENALQLAGEAGRPEFGRRVAEGQPGRRCREAGIPGRRDAAAGPRPPPSSPGDEEDDQQHQAGERDGGIGRKAREGNEEQRAVAPGLVDAEQSVQRRAGEAEHRPREQAEQRCAADEDAGSDARRAPCLLRGGAARGARPAEEGDADQPHHGSRGEADGQAECPHGQRQQELAADPAQAQRGEQGLGEQPDPGEPGPGGQGSDPERPHRDDDCRHGHAPEEPAQPVQASRSGPGPDARSGQQQAGLEQSKGESVQQHRPGRQRGERAAGRPRARPGQGPARPARAPRGRSPPGR